MGSVRCYDCERSFGRRHIGSYEVMIHDDEGLGYEMVPVPLCRGCQLRRYGVECKHCGEHHPDIEAVFECGRDRGRIQPGAGG